MAAPYSVVFICTGNSCRSQMAEALLRHLGGERFIAQSAGSHPAGYIHPLAVETMRRMNVSMEGQFSKSWHELTALPHDIVITVCDAAATRQCPLWPGHPALAHWSLPDPSFASGSQEDRLAAAKGVAQTLERWILQLIALPLHDLSPSDLKAALQRIPES